MGNPTYREILTEEELIKIENLKSQILDAHTIMAVRKIRKEIDDILEHAKERYQNGKN